VADPLYPKRLISWVENDADPKQVVKLIETDGWKNGRPPEDVKGRHYITLSYQRGRRPSVMLRRDNIESFKREGIRLEELPKTFREAIDFATHIEKVGYIWIDALCVLQDERDDWLSQSVQMDQVYGNSYLNLSATASNNSEGGLYVTRAHELLWEDTTDLNTAGISGLQRSKVIDTQAPVSRKSWTDPPELRRCVVLDASFWDELVNEAPVNKRAWVLQERMMAPRVLHFCKDQIAWECPECDQAETRPLGIPAFQLRSDDVFVGIRLKGLSPQHGEQLRRARLQTDIDPDRHLHPEIFAFELWKHIVEVYSKTQATEEGDKLVALSGIARWMASEIGTRKKPAPYVAGLWRKYLESQLLWRVEPRFDRQNRVFTHSSTRPSCYRAPSFSWASVEADEKKGIVYGEVTDQGILIRIHDLDVQPQSLDRPYGLLKKGARIFLSGKLRKAELFLFGGNGDHHSKYSNLNPGKSTTNMLCKDHVGWRLARTGYPRLEAEEHANVYLDCFQECFDKGKTKALSSEVYCLPVATGERIRGEDYIFCLLLGAEGDTHGRGTFRRIGLTKLSPWADMLAHRQIRDSFVDDEDLPCLQYDRATGEHRICII
jgi:hypothetical protein